MNKRYWLRGGVIAFVIAFVYWLIGAIRIATHTGLFAFTRVVWELSLLFLVSVTLLGMITGWIFGWIHGKVKQKHSTQGK